MDTIKLYDTAPYETDFTARVVALEGSEVVLERTLFFPEEGGQTCDEGYLEIGGVDDNAGYCQNANKYAGRSQIKVTHIRIESGVIYHCVEDLALFHPGQVVSGHISWNHRFDNMQNHTGEHIFSGIVHSRKGYDNVGFSLTKDSCQMDYNGKLTPEEIGEIEREANEAIYAAYPVLCDYPDQQELLATDFRSKKGIEGAVRLVTIPGIDTCACCAPHVKNTSEVGIIKVINSENYKGGTRLYIACGRRAYRELAADFDALTRIGHLFSTGRVDAESAVQKLIAEKQELKETILSYQQSQLFSAVDRSEDGKVYTKVTNRTLLTAAFNRLKERHRGACYIFSEKGDGSYTFLAGGQGIDARELLPALREEYEVRGGGNEEMVQGHIGVRG